MCYDEIGLHGGCKVVTNISLSQGIVHYPIMHHGMTYIIIDRNHIFHSISKCMNIIQTLRFYKTLGESYANMR